MKAFFTTEAKKKALFTTEAKMKALFTTEAKMKAFFAAGAKMKESVLYYGKRSLLRKPKWTFPNTDVFKRGRFQNVRVSKCGRFQTWAFPNVSVLYNGSQAEGILYYGSQKRKRSLLRDAKMKAFFTAERKRKRSLLQRQK